jgi:hypothetical protein
MARDCGDFAESEARREPARALPVGLLKEGNETNPGWNLMSSLHAPSAVMPRSKARSAAISRQGARLLGAVLAVSLFTAAPIIAGAFAPAQAQASQARSQASHVSVAFRAALEPYGRWERHSRWGEIWMPANRARDWRPYTLGRWVYSNDWGWYWAEDQEEAPWGWVAYHYGRWIFDRETGWAWIPGDEWGPAFVQWRHGGEYVGWAPMPPDEIVVEYRDQPDVWIFCRARDFGAARLAGVVIAPQEYSLFMRETIVVNQTVVLRDRGQFAVDPGIPPAFIAAAIGRPLRIFDVRPRILAGTAPVPGATVVGPQDLKPLRDGARNRTMGLQTSVRETPQTIAPAPRGTQLKPLAAGEQGRLGDNPPRAAQEPQRAQQRQGPPQQPQQQQDQQRLSPSTSGQGPTRERAEGGRLQNQQQGKQDQQPGGAAREREPAQTQGRSSDQQRQMREEERQRSQDRATERSRPSDTQGRGSEERRQQIDSERTGARPQQRPDTEGRGQIAPERQQPQSGRSSGDAGRAGARPQEQRSTPSATEGRGGGGGSGQVAPPQQHGPSGSSGGGAPARVAPSGGGPAGGGPAGGAAGGGHAGPRP